MLALSATSAMSADPVRGALLFGQAPQAGLLACTDCHSEDPIVNNFGNIWSGRNGLSLIERAVQSNTGGMGYFASLYDRTDLADIAAFLGQSPSRLAFAPTALGQDSPALQVTVNSSLKLGLQGLTLASEGDFAIVGGSCGASLPAFSSCSVTLAFRPSAAGPRSGALIVDHTGTPTPVRVALAGNGLDRPPAIASLSPARLLFPAAQGSRRNAVVANNSGQALRLLGLATTSTAFVLAGGSCVGGLTLAPGERCLVALRHDAGRAADLRAQLRVEHDGQGQLSTAELEVGSQAALGPALQTDRDGVDFGWVSLSTRSAVQLVTLSNPGPLAVAWRDMHTLDAAFSLVATTCPATATLQPQQHCQLALSFAPSRAGRHSSELVLRTEQAQTLLRLPLSAIAGADGGLVANTDRLALQATVGQARDGPAASLWLDQSELDFGNHRVGSAGSTLAVTVHNRGSTAWSWRQLAIVGSDGADFTPGGDCAAARPLAPGGSCRADVSFSPGATGWRTASLLLWPQGAAAPGLITLHGRGVLATTAAWQADSVVLDFGPQPAAGSVASRRLQLRNIGSAAAAPPVLTLDGPFAVAGVDPRCLAVLPPAASCWVDLRMAAGPPGPAAGRLTLHSAGSPPLVIQLAGHRSDNPVVLAWATGAEPGTWTGVPVGQIAPLPVAAGWTLVNRGATSTPPLRWSVTGIAGHEYSLATDSSCRPGLVLAPGQSCSVQVDFHPLAAGPRTARLSLWDGSAVDDLSLRGQAITSADAHLRVSPTAMAFFAQAGSHRSDLPLVLRNVGPSAGSLTLQAISGAGFEVAADPASPCAADVPELLPGESCQFLLAWNGSVAAVQGGLLTLGNVAATVAVSVPLTVTEDPAQRSNVGAGGGAWSPVWLLLLALAVLGLHRLRPESPHG